MLILKLVYERRIHFGSWNIDILSKKSLKIVDIMVKRKNNFMYLQETNWTGENLQNKKIRDLNFDTPKKLDREIGRGLLWTSNGRRILWRQRHL